MWSGWQERAAYGRPYCCSIARNESACLRKSRHLRPTPRAAQRSTRNPCSPEFPAECMLNSSITSVVKKIRTMNCLRIWRGFILCVVVALAAASAWAQSESANESDWNGHLIWVLPFENNSAQPSLDWIGASFPDILNSRLSSAGFLTIRREDRRYAMQHLGLPADFHPTQATAYRIAQTLDADYVVFGNYTSRTGAFKPQRGCWICMAPAWAPRWSKKAIWTS